MFLYICGCLCICGKWQCVPQGAGESVLGLHDKPEAVCEENDESEDEDRNKDVEQNSDLYKHTVTFINNSCIYP